MIEQLQVSLSRLLSDPDATFDQIQSVKHQIRREVEMANQTRNKESEVDRYMYMSVSAWPKDLIQYMDDLPQDKARNVRQAIVNWLKAKARGYR